ncbi:hypothetical protein [Okeania sp. SIO2B3]|uniref:hypothetical protein n=1 Tax=Okeania sp. SIO2B3 TaxID=2607784 RepID=UPI0013C04917|nr:hypothetical protein [Okeania sp. SIO2B3]NET44435.1 hypothetical protein [Okeania sp. SIO2B3]
MLRNANAFRASVALRQFCEAKANDRECLWMSNRRRPQWKQEVKSLLGRSYAINLLRYVTLCVSFIEQLSDLRQFIDKIRQNINHNFVASLI